MGETSAFSVLFTANKLHKQRNTKIALFNV
jgi:hypothetical protein